jgi:hypothetical protein
LPSTKSAKASAGRPSSFLQPSRLQQGVAAGATWNDLDHRQGVGMALLATQLDGAAQGDVETRGLGAVQEGGGCPSGHRHARAGATSAPGWLRRAAPGHVGADQQWLGGFQLALLDQVGGQGDLGRRMVADRGPGAFRKAASPAGRSRRSVSRFPSMA